MSIDLDSTQPVHAWSKRVLSGIEVEALHEHLDLRGSIYKWDGMPEKDFGHVDFRRECDTKRLLTCRK